MKRFIPVLFLILGASSLAAMKRAGKRQKLQKSAELQAPIIVQRPAVVKLSAFEQLPPELHVMILRLVAAEGDSLEGAAKNIRNALSTNRLLRQFAHNVSMQGILIKELAKRYTQENLVRAAVALGTEWAGQWLVAHLHEIKPADVEPVLYDAVGHGKVRRVHFLVTYLPSLVRAIVNNEALYISFRNAFGQEIQERVTSLAKAALDGNVELVHLLLQAGADINLPSGIHRDTPLMRAARWGRVAVVQQLLAQQGIMLDAVDRTHETVLMQVVEIEPQHPEIDPQHLQIAHQLVAAGANVNIPNAAGMTPLMLACQKRAVDLIRRLLEVPSILINAQDNAGKTALRYAIDVVNPTIVRMLLEAKANPNIADRDSFTPYRIAGWMLTDQGRTMLRLLREHGAQ